MIKINKLMMLSALVIPHFLFAGWQKELKKKIEDNNPPKWMIDQINEDLNQFKLNKQLNHATPNFKLPTYTTIFSIKKNEILYFKSPGLNVVQNRAETLKNSLEDIQKVLELPEIQFQVALGDNPQKNDVFSSFAFNRLETDNKILLPDPNSIVSSKNIPNLIEEANFQSPWNNKISKAFWRGALSGGARISQNSARFTIINISQSFPNYVDALFVSPNLNKISPEMLLYLKANKLIGERVPPSEHLKYKYQILVDGNSAPWARIYWQLFSNCVIFKQISPHMQWYYKALKPYEHYIPFAYDCSDLIEKINWAKEHDDECAKIAANATKFAIENLTYADMLYYIYLVLLEYSKL